MQNTGNDAWELSIYVPQAAAVSPALPADEAKNHSSLGDLRNAFRRVATVPADKVQAQWNRTLDTLMGLSSSIAQRAGEWRIDEIEVGFTLSAKGELLFIAEAGAEASIKFVLKPKA